jgi:ABC-2 type transport system ATP-binding protein
MESISIQNISKSFGNQLILTNISALINKGEIIGLVGPSGAGKSIFIKMLIGFLKPDTGRIIINPLIEQSIGFSMQNNSIYDMLTVKQNLNYFASIYKVPRKVRKQMIPLLIEKLNLKKFEKVIVENLSGGTKKRVDIACALLRNPEILVLDEPFLGLDPSLVASLSKFILELNKNGKTIIISSHQIQELSVLCNRVFLIKNSSLYQIEKSQMHLAYT